jgi:hypothetical protein
MAVELGLLKKTVFAKQSALGTAGSTGSQYMRRTNLRPDKQPRHL